VACEQLGFPAPEGAFFPRGSAADTEDEAGAWLFEKADASERGARAAVLVEQAAIVGFERIEALEEEEGAHHRSRPGPVRHRTSVPGNWRRRGAPGSVRRVSPRKKSPRLPSEGPWFAGHGSALEAFDPRVVGRGNDALGPGFYLTSSPENASHYGPLIHELKVQWKKAVPVAALYRDVPTAMLKALLGAIPKRDEEWDNFAETWREGFATAFRLMSALPMLRVIAQLQGSFRWYDEAPSRILSVLVDLGYTGFVVPAGSTQVGPNVHPDWAPPGQASPPKPEWAVIWDADAVRIVGVKDVRRERQDNPIDPARPPAGNVYLGRRLAAADRKNLEALDAAIERARAKREAFLAQLGDRQVSAFGDVE